MTAPAPLDRKKSGRLTTSGLPTRSKRTFSPGEMTVRTFIQHVLTNALSIHNISLKTTIATFRTAAIEKSLKGTELAARFHELGADSGTLFGEKFGDMLKAETTKWADVIHSSGAKAN